MQTLKTLGALAVLATVGSTLTIGTYLESAHAQTLGMERRSDRRATRQESRAAKHACNASNETSRAECRHLKHEVKQTGRQGELAPMNTTAPAYTPPQ
jgi:hypothetical protein